MTTETDGPEEMVARAAYADATIEAVKKANGHEEGRRYSDIFFLREAYFMARYSRDPSSQNGAVIVTTDGITAHAANNFPVGVVEAPERWVRPTKYQYIEHAERGAIYAAARMGLSTAHSTLYCPWFACADCARAIVCAGVTEVVGHFTNDKAELERWADSVAVGLMILEEGGVKTRYLHDHTFGLNIRRDGEVVTV